MLNLAEITRDFLSSLKKEDIYNEFSLQHELGIFLRKNLDCKYKVQFERNVSFFAGNKNYNDNKIVKKEIDIVIYTEDKKEKYAIELKYPRNGQVPEQMFSFIKDIKFMEQVKDNLGFDSCLCLTIVDNESTGFYQEKPQNNEIYSYFRNCSDSKYKINIPSNIEIEKPTGKDKSEPIILTNCYQAEWKTILDGLKGYIIEV